MRRALSKGRAAVAVLGALAALAAGTGCSFTPAMNAYCTETELCVCDGADCCIKSGNTCEDGLCCGRLVCSADGFCEKGPHQPFLTITPPGFDFGQVVINGPDPLPSQVFTVTNVGEEATGPLQRRVKGSIADLALVEDTCQGQALAPGASCTLRVEVTLNGSPGFKTLTFAYFESPDVDTAATVTALLPRPGG